VRILVFRGGALGDFLVTRPALRSLRDRWPAAEITLVGNRTAAELGLLDGTVQAVHDQHDARWVPLFDSAPLPVSLQDWLESFDRIFNCWPDPDGQLARHFAAWGERYIAGTAAVSSRPAARHFLTPLQRWGCREGDLSPRLTLPSVAEVEAERRLGGMSRFVAIHAGSGSPRKTWPLERWHTVAAALRRPILWITGEADAAGAPPVGPHLCQAHHWPLAVLAAALARCDQYLGHDTGVSHLAAAVGAPGLALFGPTDPTIWAPPSPRWQVLCAPGGDLNALTVDAVLAALPSL
jgi:heptosyltransferase III